MDIEALKKLGSEWKKGDHYRIYLDVKRFCHASVNPKTSKLYYDVNAGAFRGTMSDDHLRIAEESITYAVKRMQENARLHVLDEIIF